MKNKKLILILSIMAIIIVMLVIVAVTTLYFTTDIFKSNDQLFAKYLSQENNLETLLQLEIADVQEEFKKNNSYISSGTVLAEIQKEGQAVQGVQISINSKYDNTTKRNYSEMTLKDGNIDLINASYIHNDNIYGIKCDKIYENYIGFRNSDLKRFASAMGASEEIIAQIPDTLPLGTTQREKIISEEDKQYLADTYMPIMIASIPKEKYGKTQQTNITIEGQEYLANGYTLTLNEEDIRTILKNILTKANEDTATIKIIHTMLSAIGVSQEQIPQLTEQVLSNLLEAIQTNEMQATNLEITVYQSNGKNIRTQIKINDITVLVDIASNVPNNQKLIFNMQVEGNNAIQAILEKQITDTQTNSKIEITTSNEQKEYKIAMDTTLGNWNNNTFHNISKVTIQDFDSNTINISYDKTIQLANETIEILELKNSNSVIVNNYPREQLEPFFEGITNKSEEIFENILAQLKINETNQSNNITQVQNNALAYSQAIAGTILTIGNANGANPIIGITASSIMVATNQMLYLQRELMNTVPDVSDLQQQEQQIYNRQFTNYKGVQSAATIRTLCNTVAINNMTLLEGEIPVTIVRSFATKETASESTQTIKAVTQEEIKNLSEQIEIGKQYNVELEYDLTGDKIVTIIIFDV